MTACRLPKTRSGPTDAEGPKDAGNPAGAPVTRARHDHGGAHALPAPPWTTSRWWPGLAGEPLHRGAEQPRHRSRGSAHRPAQGDHRTEDGAAVVAAADCALADPHSASHPGRPRARRLVQMTPDAPPLVRPPAGQRPGHGDAPTPAARPGGAHRRSHRPAGHRDRSDVATRSRPGGRPCSSCDGAERSTAPCG